MNKEEVVKMIRDYSDNNDCGCNHCNGTADMMADIVEENLTEPVSNSPSRKSNTGNEEGRQTKEK